MKVKFKELNSGYEGQHRVSRTSQKNKSKAIIIGVLVFAFLFVYILSSVGVIPMSAVTARVKSGISGDGERFPVAINTESTICTDIIGDNIILLTTENVAVYSPHGKLLFSQPHIFAKPGLSVNGKKATVFDRGGTGFMLLTDEKLVYEGQAENTIITAEYGENGSYALGTRSKTATSALTVYGKSHKVAFQWNCSYEHIVSIALSDNGKYVGAAVMGAENGGIFTTVQYFGIEYKEPLNTQKITGATALDLDFTAYNVLTLLADNGVYKVERKAEKYEAISTYYSAEFNSCDISDKGNFVVSLAKYGSENVFEISVYKPKGKVKTIITANYEILSVYMSGKYIFALSDNKIVVYNLNGNQVSEIEIKGEVTSLLPTDDFIFTVSLDKISRSYTYGDAVLEL